MEGSCPFRAQKWRNMCRDPGRRIYDAKTGCTRHSPSELGSALVCTVSVPGLIAVALSARLACRFNSSIFQYFHSYILIRAHRGCGFHSSIFQPFRFRCGCGNRLRCERGLIT